MTLCSGDTRFLLGRTVPWRRRGDSARRAERIQRNVLRVWTGGLAPPYVLVAI